jgi:hypothetical protein
MGMIAKRPRAKGKVVTVAPVPKGYLAVEADRILAERQARLKAAAIARAERPVPNTICYKEAFANWKPGDKVPRCLRCDGVLHPGENHKCEGFVAKFKEHTEETHQRFEARREAIRESRPERRIVCSVCGEELPEPEDAEEHWYNHEGRPEREHYAVDGEHDGDLDGYEDEPEEDYCEGDDDGYDCD